MTNSKQTGKAIPDISALVSSVNDAASRAATYWFSFLMFLAYLTMTVGAVTHEMLLRGSVIKLPLLNVELPLVAFFFVSPAFLLLFHFYLFLNLALLVRKAAAFRDALEREMPDESIQDLQRQRLDTFMVLQLIGGPKEIRDGTTGRLLRFATLITLILAPIAVLIQIQLTFLPYHHTWITWVQRIAILLDLRLAWVFWRTITENEGKIDFPEARLTWHKLRHPFAATRSVYRQRQLAFLSSVIVVFASLFVINHRGEWLSQAIAIQAGADDKTLSDWFLHGPIDMVVGRPAGWFFYNVLVVPNTKLVKDSDWNEDRDYPSLSLRGRDLRGAVLIGSDLRGADFTGANLNDARLDRAILTRARFGCSLLRQNPESHTWPKDECTWLQNVSLFEAQLQETDFTNARMQGAILLSANLQGATLDGTLLEDAVLIQAKLQGARVTAVDASRAYLEEANLIGARIEGTRFNGALVSRTSFELAIMKRVSVDGSKGRPGLIVGENNNSGLYLADFTTEPFNGATDIKYDRNRGQRIRSQVLDLLPPDRRFKYTQAIERFNREPDTDWHAAKKQKEDDEKNKENLAARDQYLEGIICGADSAPYMTRGIVNNAVIKRVFQYLITADNGQDITPSPTARRAQAQKVNELVSKFMRAKEQCLGANGLRSADFEQIDTYRRELGIWSGPSTVRRAAAQMTPDPADTDATASK
jgi:hypothetical protein